MAKKKWAPVDWVFLQMGGPTKAANALGRNTSTLYRWKKNGIPQDNRLNILAWAKKNKKDIKSSDLDFGRVK